MLIVKSMVKCRQRRKCAACVRANNHFKILKLPKDKRTPAKNAWILM